MFQVKYWLIYTTVDKTNCYPVISKNNCDPVLDF